MTEFLIKTFIKDRDAVEKAPVRTAYGVLASVVGMICNLLLFVGKLVVGTVLHSVSVTADAFNNLSDVSSSVISFIGVKIAGKPADKGHPFGHGRAEYVAALVVSFLIMEVGFTFLKSSVSRIFHPEVMRFQAISLAILLLSVGAKLWLGLFNRKLGEKIDSKVMKAVFADSMSDVISTSATILSLVFFRISGVNVDGFVGTGVALGVMWGGFSIAKDTIEPLLGEAIDPKIYDRVKEYVEGFPGMIGTHDLIIHNYGPNRNMATIHAEVPNTAGLENAHALIDKIEKSALGELGILLVIHMDPVEVLDQKVIAFRRKVQQKIYQLEPMAGFHDFRMEEKEDELDIDFDVLVPYSYSEKQKEELRNRIILFLKQLDSRCHCMVTVEYGFKGERSEKRREKLEEKQEKTQEKTQEG